MTYCRGQVSKYIYKRKYKRLQMQYTRNATICNSLKGHVFSQCKQWVRDGFIQLTVNFGEMTTFPGLSENNNPGLLQACKYESQSIIILSTADSLGLQGSSAQPWAAQQDAPLTRDAYQGYSQRLRDSFPQQIPRKCAKLQNHN